VGLLANSGDTPQRPARAVALEGLGITALLAAPIAIHLAHDNASGAFLSGAVRVLPALAFVVLASRNPYDSPECGGCALLGGIGALGGLAAMGIDWLALGWEPDRQVESAPALVAGRRRVALVFRF
jgi:hypothetical protein